MIFSLIPQTILGSLSTTGGNAYLQFLCLDSSAIIFPTSLQLRSWIDGTSTSVGRAKGRRVYDFPYQRAVWKPQPNLGDEQLDNNIASAHVDYSDQVKSTWIHVVYMQTALEQFNCLKQHHVSAWANLLFVSSLDLTRLYTIFIHISVFVFRRILSFSIPCARHIQQGHIQVSSPSYQRSTVRIQQEYIQDRILRTHRSSHYHIDSPRQFYFEFSA